MNIETYDIVMLTVLVAATMWGAYKGLVWQLASLASLVLSYVVAYQFRDIFAPWVPVAAPWNMVLAMLFLFLLTALGIWIVCQEISKFIDRLKLKGFDRQLGALLGCAKGVLLCVLITLFAVALLGEPERQAIVNSRSGYLIAVLIRRSHSLIPEEIQQVLEPYFEVLESPEETGSARPAEGEMREQGSDVRAVRRGPWRSVSEAVVEPVASGPGGGLSERAERLRKGVVSGWAGRLVVVGNGRFSRGFRGSNRT